MNDADKKLLELAEKANLPWVQTQNMRFGVKIWNALQECIAEWIGGVDRSTIPALWQSEMDYAQAAANAVPRLIAEKEAMLKRIETLRVALERYTSDVYHNGAGKNDDRDGTAVRALAADDDAAAKEGTND